MEKELKKNFLQFQKAYAPVNINDNNNVTDNEISDFDYNYKMDILPIFNCNIWFGDYEGYDSFTRRYRVPYPITGYTFTKDSGANDDGILNDDIMDKLEFCLRILILLHEDYDLSFIDINNKYKLGGTDQQVEYLNSILKMKNLIGFNNGDKGNNRKDYFNNFFNNGLFTLEGTNYKVNNFDKNNNFCLFPLNLGNKKEVIIYKKKININDESLYIKLNYLIKFSLNKVATYGLCNLKENNSFKMRSNDKILDEKFDKATIDNDNNKCSFILTKPNNSKYVNNSLAKDIVEEDKAFIYKPKKLINKEKNAKRVYPINKDSFNIIPPNIINEDYIDGKNISDEPYYWIGYYDTFSYLNCNINFDTEEEWNEMLTYNSSCCESLNDMICFTSPLNYYNLSNTEKKKDGNYQTSTLDNTNISNLPAKDDFSFYNNNGSIYKNNNTMAGGDDLSNIFRSRSLSRPNIRNYSSLRSTSRYNPTFPSAISKKTSDFKVSKRTSNKLENLNNIRVGQPYMSASRDQKDTDNENIIKNSEGIYKIVKKDGASNSILDGEGINFKLILDRNYNISESSACKIRFPYKHYNNTTNKYDYDDENQLFESTDYEFGQFSKSDQKININETFYNCNTNAEYKNKMLNLNGNNELNMYSNLFNGFPNYKSNIVVSIDKSNEIWTNFITNFDPIGDINKSFKGIKNMKTLGPRIPPSSFYLEKYKQNTDTISILNNKGYQHNMHELIKNYRKEYEELKGDAGDGYVIEYCIRKYIGKGDGDNERKINFVGLPIIDVFNSSYKDNYNDPSPPVKNSDVINQMRPKDCYTSCTNIDNSFRYIRFIYMTITLSLTISKVLRHYIKNLVKYYFIIRSKIDKKSDVVMYNKSKIIMLINNTLYNLKNYEKLIRIVFGQVPFINDKNKIEGDLLIMQYLGIVFSSTKEFGFQNLEDSIKKLNKVEEYLYKENLFPFKTKLEHDPDDDIWNSDNPGDPNYNWTEYLNGLTGEKVEEFGNGNIRNLKKYNLFTFDIEETQKSLTKLIKILPLLGEKSCSIDGLYEPNNTFNIKNYCLGGISVVDSNNFDNNLKVLLAMNISSGLIKEEKLMLINKYNQLKEDVLSYIPQFERDKIIDQIENKIVNKIKKIATRSGGQINDTNTLILLAKGNNSGQMGFLTLLYTYLLKYKNMSGANSANINKTLQKYPGITKKKGLFNLNSLLNSDPNEAKTANNEFNRLAKEKRNLEKLRFQTEFYFKETIRQLRILYIANIIPLGYYYWCVCKIQNMIIDMRLTYDEEISNKNSFSEVQQKRLYKDIGYGNGVTSKMLNTLAKRKTISNLLDKVSLIDNECYDRKFWIKRETEFNESNKTYLNIDSNTNNYYYWVLYLPVVLYETIEYPVGSGKIIEVKRSALIDIFKFAQDGYSNIRNNYTFNDINNATDIVNIKKSGGRLKEFNNNTNLYETNNHGFKEVPSIIYLEDMFKVDNNLFMSNFQSVIGNYEHLPVYCKKINKVKYAKNNTNIFNFENDVYYKVRPMVLSGSEKTFNSLLNSGNLKNDNCNIPFFLIDCRKDSTMSQKYIRVLFYQLLYSLPAMYNPNKLYDYYDNLINKWINLEKKKYSEIKDGKPQTTNIPETYNFEQERLIETTTPINILLEKKIKKDDNENETIKIKVMNVNSYINVKDIYGNSEWIDEAGRFDNLKKTEFLNKFKFIYYSTFRTQLLIGSTLNKLNYNSDFEVNMPPAMQNSNMTPDTINNYNIDENLNKYLPYNMGTIGKPKPEDYYLPGNTINIQEYLSRHRLSRGLNIYQDYFLKRFRTNFYLPALWRLKTTSLVDNSGNNIKFNPKYEGRTRNKLMVDSNLFSKLSPMISDLATDKSKQDIIGKKIKAKGYESGNTCFVSIIQLKKLLLSYEEPESVMDSFGAKISSNETLNNDFFKNL